MEEKHFNKINEDYQDWLINRENSIGKEKAANENKGTGIKKLISKDIVSFDFLQDSSNKIIVNKINEIIDYLDNIRRW